MARCRSCGATVEDGDEFCGQCGAPVGPAGEQADGHTDEHGRRRSEPAGEQGHHGGPTQGAGPPRQQDPPRQQQDAPPRQQPPGSRQQSPARRQQANAPSRQQANAPSRQQANAQRRQQPGGAGHPRGQPSGGTDRRTLLKLGAGAAVLGAAGLGWKTLGGGGSGGGPFVDTFEDGSYEDRWTVTEADDEEIREAGGHLIHYSPTRHNEAGDLLTVEDFPATGQRTIEVRMRTEQSNYWEYGFGIQFEEGGLHLREHKWARNDTLRLDLRGDDATAKLGEPNSSTEWHTYELDLDFDAEAITGLRRGEESFDVTLDFSAVASDRFRLRIGVGRGHRVRYDEIRLR